MQDEILQTNKFEEIYFIIENYCGSKLDIRTMMEKFADPISIKEVERLRKEQRVIIMEMLKRQLQATNFNHTHLFPRLKFISNFQLYYGLTKYYQMTQERSEKHHAAARLLTQTMEKFEQDLMSIYNCSPSWPICLFDFTFKNQCPKYVAFRV